MNLARTGQHPHSPGPLHPSARRSLPVKVWPSHAANPRQLARRTCLVLAPQPVSWTAGTPAGRLLVETMDERYGAGPSQRMTQSPPARGTAHSGDGKITRELVLTTALEIIDHDGADALSMRRLGAALDHDPMILYRHAPGKAALLDGVVEVVLAQLHVDPADPDWAAQLRSVARDYRALTLEHPNVVPLLVTRPLATPLALRPPRHPAPARRRPRAAHPRWVQRTRRAARLPGLLRLPERSRAQRAARTRREPGRDRRPAAAGPVSAADRRFPAAPQPRPCPGGPRRCRRTRTRPRYPADRASRNIVALRRKLPGCPRCGFKRGLMQKPPPVRKEIFHPNVRWMAVGLAA